MCDRCKGYVDAPVKQYPHEAMMEVPKNKRRGNGDANVSRTAEQWLCFTCGSSWMRDIYGKDEHAKWQLIHEGQAGD
jgi:hypothetical protein